MALPSQPINDKGEIEVPVVCATRDFQGAVAETVVTLWNTLYTMKRSPVYCQFQSHGYAFVRAGVFRNLRDGYKMPVIRGFMIDDDILLKSDQQQQLAIAIDTADKFGWNFVSPYRTRDGYVAVARANGDLLRPDEVIAMAPFTRVDNGGLGFYYGDLPLDYKFHEEGVFGGEDLNFFHENPQLELRIVNLNLRHLKVHDLTLETPLPYQKRPWTKPNTNIKTAEELGLQPDEHPRIRE